MKKWAKIILSLVLTAAMALPVIPWRVEAANGDVPLTVFTDEDLRARVKKIADINGDDILSSDEVRNCTELDIYNYNVESVDGLEFLTSLQKLVIGHSVTSRIDLSGNTALKSLSIANCAPTAIIFPQSAALTALEIHNVNSLSSFDFSKCPNLEELDCSYNDYLTQIDLSKNTTLTKLTIRYNDSLPSLDLSKNTRLEDLDVSNNRSLTSIDLSQNVALKSLSINNNNLTSLNLSQNAKLESLDCSYNEFLTSIDLSRNTELWDLRINNCSISSMILPSGIICLKCSDNNLDVLDTTIFDNLQALDCSNNNIKSLPLAHLDSLIILDCSNNALTELDIHNSDMLTEIGEFLPGIGYTGAKIGPQKSGTCIVTVSRSQQKAGITTGSGTTQILAETEPVRLISHFGYLGDGNVELQVSNYSDYDKIKIYRKVDAESYECIKTLNCINQSAHISDKVNSEARTVSYKAIGYYSENDTTVFGPFSDIITLLLKAPGKVNVTSVTFDGQNVVLRWDKVDNAYSETTYTVRRYVDGTYDKSFFTSTKDQFYEDCTIERGHSYVYGVAAVTQYVISNDDDRHDWLFGEETKVNFTFPEEKPTKVTIASIAVADTCATLKWGQVIGATGYQIYRSEDGGAYTRVKTAKALTFTDENVEKGHTYSYKVRAYSTGADGVNTFGSFGAVKTVTVKPEPVTFSSVTAGTGSVALKWAAAQGAAKYQVYRSDNGSAYARIKTTTALAFTDTNVEVGHTYSYKVRGYCTVDGTNITGSCGAVKTVTIAPAKPAGVTFTNAKGVTIKWTKAAGAAATQVYRQNADGTWTRVKTVVGSTWTDTDVVSGKSYTYKLRSYCTDAAGKNVYSGCTTSATITYVAPPTLSKTAVAGGVKLSWAKVTGAAGYQVYRREGSGSFEKLTTTSSLTYTDTNCAAGKTYSYKIRAYKKVSGTNYFSAFSNVVTK